MTGPKTGPDGRYRDHASVAPVGQPNGLGRWECSKSHLEYYSDICRQRFPRPAQ